MPKSQTAANAAAVEEFTGDLFPEKLFSHLHTVVMKRGRQCNEGEETGEESSEAWELEAAAAASHQSKVEAASIHRWSMFFLLLRRKMWEFHPANED